MRVNLLTRLFVCFSIHVVAEVKGCCLCGDDGSAAMVVKVLLGAAIVVNVGPARRQNSTMWSGWRWKEENRCDSSSSSCCCCNVKRKGKKNEERKVRTKAEDEE